MEYIQIFLLIVLIFVVIFQKLPKKQAEIPKIEEKKEEKPQISEEDKKKQEKIKKAFNNLMEYDENIALKKEEE